MKIDLYPELLYRIPRFSFNATLTDSYEPLKEAISLSSPEFYKLVNDKPAAELSAAIQHTLWKYFNRARFRATPYGNFAAIGCATLSGASRQGLVVSDEIRLHTLPDWNERNDFLAGREPLLKATTHVVANHSYYRVGKIIRFLCLRDGTFNLAEIESDPESLRLLAYCNRPVAIAEVQEHFPQPEDLIRHLISCQLMLTDQHPNIIGQDYFQRLDAVLRPGHKTYMIALRPLSSGAADTHLLRQLPALAEKLAALNEQNEPADLKTFKSRFRHKFVARTIPVMLALDPETGIGYGDLEQDASGRDFVFQLEKEPNHASKDFLQKELLRRMISDTTTLPAVIDLETMEGKSTKVTLPNTFSALCSVEGRFVKVEHMGGCTANALLGRFTPASQPVKTVAETWARIEQQANPHVQFFDVGYMAEGFVDNINRREAIYPYQLSILNYDTSEAPLTLDDLYLSLNGDDLIIRSMRLNRRMIPRIASAYNHRRSNLPLFRLLSDLQYQGLVQ